MCLKPFRPHPPTSTSAQPSPHIYLATQLPQTTRPTNQVNSDPRPTTPVSNPSNPTHSSSRRWPECNLNPSCPLLKPRDDPSSYQEHHLTSIAESVRANQYGYVKTPSFFQCGGINSEKNEDFEVELITNTALRNTLMADSIYALSGKIIALNDGSTPILSYFQDSVVRIGATGQDQPDFTNKSIVTSLGMVISRREVADSASDSGSHLEVIVAHCDWDGQERVHRRFNIKYIVPGTKNLVKTHTLYQIGREINIIGRLVDFHMEDHMAVVVVSSVSVTSGHQIGQTNTSNPSASTSSPIQGRKFTKFSPKTPAAVKGPSTSQVTKPPLPSLHPEATTSSAIRGPTPAKLTKGKSKATSEYESDSEESSDNDESEPSDAEAQNSPPPKTKRGRPRKNIIQEAAKRM
ncbi:hypothetical protein PGTUg99_014713 [Puccinia graminis f. sp. tritici]|uniref:Uncharacterized protein n=1 Tax=Puccinia graminis f. sp. tritici TaxID=56615 RepID=A0A5B0PAS9_PUCGR|nr:hypothetical protein PGTUg99_014713 [Puccinia graminis f. sp. tritici]